LAILAAIAIPALTGYIDKANKKAAIAAARTNITALQTLLSEEYAAGSDWLTAESGSGRDESSDSFLMHRVAGLQPQNADGTITIALSPGSGHQDKTGYFAEWESLTGYIYSDTYAANPMNGDCQFQALVDPATYQIKGFGMIMIKGEAPEYYVTWNLDESAISTSTVAEYYITKSDNSGYQVFTPAEFGALLSA
jgi:Tfp pilus assembly protein PilE